jgi:DNA-binding LacI/PurR family transcriptional regulator
MIEIDLPPNARVANKYRRVVGQIREKISSGEYSGMLPGTKLLAATYGVSLMTADKAVKVLEKERLVVRYPRKGTLIHTPSQAKPETFALVVRDVSMPLTSRVIGAFGEMARGQGIQTLFFQHFDDVEKEAAILEELANDNRVDGVVIVPCSRGERKTALRALGKAKIPAVVLGLTPSSEWPDSCHVVAFDEHAAFAEGTRQLLDLGHRKIALVFPRQWDGLPLAAEYGDDPRWLGYAEAMKTAGLQPVPPIWFDTDKMFDHQEVAKFIETITMYTALFLHHDTFSATVLTTLHREGIHVPDDISLLSYDGAPLATALDLATMELPMERVALRAVEMLRESKGVEACQSVREVFKASMHLRNSLASV